MYARYIPPAKGSAGSAKPNRVPEPEPYAETQPEIAAVAAAPTAQVGDAGFTYSRYVPGAAKSSKQKPIINGVNHDDDDAHASSKRKREVAEESVESKRSRRETSGDDHATEVQAALANDDTKAPKKSKKDKKEKKDGKKKDKKRRSHADDDSADDDAADPNTAHDGAKTRNESDSIHKDEAPRESLPPTEADGGESIEKEVKRQKHPKREKSKKSKQEASAAADEYDDSEIDSRHKSMLERKTKALKLAADYEATKGDEEEEEEPMELHDLEPLPQPAQPIADTAGPSFETLPAWLAAPVRVSQSTRTSFTDLGLLPKAARVLEEKGFKDAFAVQTAAIPLLLPSSRHQPGDLLISAATGSGKTLAYALPIARDISQGVVTRLRALVVLPTRELVKQAQEVFELCAKAFEGGERKRVRIGIAIGSQSLKHEQNTLMGREIRYDLAEYMKLESEAENLLGFASGETDPRLGTWDGQIIDHMSKVDVLLCTPGRLVEHLEQTPGFSLDFVRWLVVDEADKILAQSFQGWLDMVMERFQVNRFGARDFPDVDCTGVRKVVLSATLTRDLSLLSQLALRRPQLIVLENDGEVQVAEHTLPSTLREHAIRVHDANLKPLYLLDLLKGEQMKPTATGAGEVAAADGVSDSGTSSDDSSDTSSEGDSDSDTSSDATSDTSSDSSSDDSTPAKPTKTSSIPIALIFTKSNESALRLSRLLAILDPALSQHISTLTSTTPSQTRRKTLRAFTTSSSPIRLIIASDLVARGIDLPKLDHVINYDLPPSVAGYVHRVGRTARAGRSGSAWTLVGDDESGWFWGRIAKNVGVRRAEKVGRVRLEERGQEEVQRYEEALEQLGKEALELRRR